MALQAPSILAQLPRPLTGSAGKCHFAEVCGLAGSKKRKRYEISTAIDGESINVYSVQFPKLISSYAIPPQSAASCPPCSVREKSTETSTVKRYTYCAFSRPERQIKCFVEEFTSSDRSSAQFSTSMFPLDDSESPVVHMTVVPSIQPRKQREAFDLIVVHENGQVRRLSSDLKSQKWNIAQPASDTFDHYEVHAGFSVSFEDAQKTLLKKRQDVVASILGDGHGIRPDLSTILVLILHPAQAKTLLPSEVAVHLFSIPAYNSVDALTISQRQNMRCLMELKLPDVPGLTPIPLENVSWAANMAQAELSLSFGHGYISYNISHYSPEVDSHMILKDAAFSSVMRISPRSIISANSSTVSLYDAKYRSLQTNLHIAAFEHLNTHKQVDSLSSLKFITHFPKLGVIVAVHGSSLLAFDISALNRWGEHSRKRQRTGLLIDSIGKGVGLLKNEMQQQGIDDKSSQSATPIGFKRLETADELTEPKSRSDSSVKADQIQPVDGATGFGLKKGSSTADGLVDQEKIYHLLSTIFPLQAGSESNTLTLVVNSLPSATFRWLLRSQHLSLSNIQIALRTANPDGVTPIIPKGSLVRAFAQSDRSLSTLLLALRSPIHLDVTELGNCLQLLLETARSHTVNSVDQKVLTESPQKQPPSSAVENMELNKNSNGNGKTVANAVIGLNLTLIRLHSYSLSDVAQALRSTLSNSDLLSIIHHLRHSLVTGGYTSPITENLQPPSTKSKFPQLSHSTIIDLLNASIDAVGPSGWISAAAFAGAEGSQASLITDMKSEVSAALAGVEEATYLKGVVREFIRCCETAKKSKRKRTKREEEEETSGLRIKRTEWSNGAQIVVYENASDSSGLLNTDTKMLPLSLKLTAMDGSTGEEPSTKKVVKGTGEVKQRTKRDLGYLKGKTVGKYSFERIII